MSRREEPRSEHRSSSGRTVDARQLWPGGATAIVAALIALVGILLCRWLFSVPVLAPRQDGAWGDASTAGYRGRCRGGRHDDHAPAPDRHATAADVLHLIIGLATVIAVVYPFGTAAPLSQKAATAVINLVLGAAIGSLINEAAARVTRRRAITGGYQPSYPLPAPGN